MTMWYPGKYAGQALQAAGQVASKAAAVAQTAVNHGLDDVKSAYDNATKQFNDASKEVAEALEVASNRKMFEDKAMAIIHERRGVIGTLSKATGQLSNAAYAEISRKLLTPGVVTNTAQAKALTTSYVQSSTALQQLAALTDDLRVLSLGWHASIGAGVGVEIAGLGSPIPILRIDRTDFLPYPYSESSLNIGAQLTVDLGITAGLFKGQANAQWGFFVVASVFAGEGGGAGVDVYFRLPEGEFDGISVSGNVEADALPVGCHVGVGRTFSLPLFYLSGGYSRATAG